MKVTVTTYNEEDELVTAIFEVVQDFDAIEVELFEAKIKTHTGRVRMSNETELSLMGIFEELVHDAMEKFNVLEDAAEREADLADSTLDA